MMHYIVYIPCPEATQIKLFCSVHTRIFWKNLITAATTGYDNSSEGFNPGQYSADDRDALLGSIQVAQEVLENTASTPAQLIAAADELNSIFTSSKRR